MKKAFLIITMMVLALGASALTLEECVLRGSSPRGIGAMQPSKSDGRYFYRLSDDGNAINRISYAKGDESVLVDTRNELVTGWDDFEVTADGAYVLLWNNSQEIYRYSFSADYYVYDLKNKTLKSLSDGGGEEIATLSPDGKRVMSRTTTCLCAIWRTARQCRSPMTARKTTSSMACPTGCTRRSWECSTP